MAIAWRNGTSAVTPGSATSVVINVPSGVANGDLLLLLLNTDAGGSTHSTPGGWTAVPVSGLNWNPGALGAKVASLWWRIAASEPASYTLTWTGSNEGAAVMGAWSGTDATTPLGGVNDVLTVGSSQASPATLTASAVSSLVGNSQIVVVGLVDQSNNTPQATWTTSSGMTVRVQVSSAAVNFCGGMMADVAQASTGTSGTKAFTATAAGETYIPFAYTLVLAPPAAPLPPDEDFPGPLPRPVAWYPPPVQALLDESELVVNGPSFLRDSTGTLDGDVVNGETVNGEYGTATPLPCEDEYGAAWALPPQPMGFASAMLFAALAACSHGQAHDDDYVFTAPPAVVDEDAYRAPRPQPQPPPLWAEYVLGNEDDVPAGSLRGAPDEDFWIPPFPATVIGGGAGQQPAPRVYLPDPDEVDLPLAAPQDVEPDWAIPVLLGSPSLPPPLVLRNVEDDIPAGSLAGAPDLDEAWRNPVAPVPPAHRVPPPVWEGDEVPAGSLRGQPDEDTPPPLPAPVAGSLWQRLPYLPDGDQDVPALYGVAEEEAPPLTRPWATTAVLALTADDELPAPGYTLDEDGWASGVQPTPPANRCSLPWEPEADELPGALSGQFDEDFGPPLPAPVQASSRVALPLGDADELPAATLRGQPDEDYWTSGVAPQAAANRVSLPWEPELDELPSSSLYGQPDEDFAGPRPAPVAASNFRLLPLGDADSEVPSLYGVPEEDAYQPPRPAPLTAARPYADTDETPTTPLGYQLDEDYWTSGVAPTQGTNRQQYLPDDELPAATLTGQPDEDFGPPLPAPVPGRHGRVYLPDADSETPTLSGVAEEDSSAPRPVPLVAANRVSLPWEPDLDEISSALTGQPDEDYWTSGVAPTLAANRCSLPWEPELDELPAASLSGQPDEDFGPPLPAPVPPRSLVLLPLGDPEAELPAATLYGVPEEDAYRAPVLPTAGPPLLASAAEDEFPPQTLPPDEDFWSVALGKAPPLPPIVITDPQEWVPFIATQVVEDEPYLPPVTRPTGNFYAWPYLPDRDEDTPRLYGVPEEDSTAPLPQQQRWPPLPVRASAETDEPSRLSGTPDADEAWQNWVAPVPATLGRLYLPDPEELPAATLSGMPDEDFPGPLPAPVQARHWLRLAWLPDAEDLPRLYGTAEEDFWRSGVAPVAASNWQRLPLAPDTEHLPRLYGVPEEDQYRAPIPPPPPLVLARTADDEVTRAVVDEDWYRAPPPWVDLIVRPFSEGDEWPTTITVEEDLYGAPAPWPIPPPVRPQRDSDEWVPYVSLSLGMDEDWYAPPRQSIPAVPLRAYQGVEDETHLRPPRGISVSWGGPVGGRRYRDDPTHPVPPGGWPTGDGNDGPLTGGMI